MLLQHLSKLYFRNNSCWKGRVAWHEIIEGKLVLSNITSLSFPLLCKRQKRFERVMKFLQKCRSLGRIVTFRRRLLCVGRLDSRTFMSQRWKKFFFLKKCLFQISFFFKKTFLNFSFKNIIFIFNNFFSNKSFFQKKRFFKQKSFTLIKLLICSKLFIRHLSKKK